MALACLPISLFSYWQHQWLGVGASLLAAGVCWLAATAALVITATLRGPEAAVQGMLLAMLFRLGLPMAAALLLGTQRGPLSEANLLILILVYYLIALATETPLALRFVNHNPPASSSDAGPAKPTKAS